MVALWRNYVQSGFLLFWCTAGYSGRARAHWVILIVLSFMRDVSGFGGTFFRSLCL